MEDARTGESVGFVTNSGRRPLHSLSYNSINEQNGPYAHLTEDSLLRFQTVGATTGDKWRPKERRRREQAETSGILRHGVM